MDVNKKKVGGALGGAAVVGAAIALTAGTFSYFSDQTHSQPQNVSAGTLSLTVGGQAQSHPLNLTNVEPGYTSQPESITFHNAGSVSGRLRISVQGTGHNSPGFNQSVHLNFSGAGPVVSGDHTLADDIANTKNGVRVYDLGPGGYKSFNFTVSVPGSVGNELQGDSGGFRIKADLIQLGVGGPADPGAAFPAPPAS